jgi:hypothetical protein
MDMAVVVVDEFKGSLEFAGAKNLSLTIKTEKGGIEANLNSYKGR